MVTDAVAAAAAASSGWLGHVQAGHKRSKCQRQMLPTAMNRETLAKTVSDAERSRRSPEIGSMSPRVCVCVSASVRWASDNKTQGSVFNIIHRIESLLAVRSTFMYDDALISFPH
eukprot:2250995-Amphidinium_carterae.1